MRLTVVVFGLMLILLWVFSSIQPFSACLLLEGKRLQQLDLRDFRGNKTFNTSLARYHDAIVFASRVSNYTMCNGLLPSLPPYRSETIFWLQTQEGPGRCQIKPIYPEGSSAVFFGYEDPRIIILENEVCLICSLVHQGFSTICVLRFRASDLLQKLRTSAQTGSLTHLAPTSIEGPLRYKNETGHEKNWSPFVFNDDLHLIRSIQPLIILRLRDGVLQEVRTEPLCLVPASLKSFHLRGGSCAVPWTDTQYIAVGHVVDSKLVFSKSYYSFFYVFETEPFRLVAFSEPFKLEGARIEFVTGLLIVENEVWVTGGVMDCESVLWRLTRDRVEALLVPTPSS
jgi:hypothetical protein